MKPQKEIKKVTKISGKMFSSIFINLEKLKDDSFLSTNSTDTLKSLNTEQDSEKGDSSINNLHFINEDDVLPSNLSEITLFTNPATIISGCLSGLSSSLCCLLENTLINFFGMAFQIRYPLTIYHILSKSWINLKIVNNKLKFHIDQDRKSVV